MDFPKRIQQHKAQSDSFAILLYKLKDLGIFRSATDNDYGIDLEIEIVHDERVIGKYLKVQVKSSEKINIRKDGTPTVRGIKQSTLLYWIEMSYNSHVVACAVDLKTERIYISKPVFWQATCLLDKTDKTKTIEFLPEFKINENSNESVSSQKEGELVENKLNELILKWFAFKSNISDIVFAHKSVLRIIKNLFELYADTWHYDPWTEVQQIDTFKTFLDCSKILVDLPEKLDDFEEKNKKLIFSFEYWGIKTAWSYNDVSNAIAKVPMKILFPLLLRKTKIYSDYVLKGEYYWKRKDLTYLRLVQSVKLPDNLDHDTILEHGYNTEKLVKPTSITEIFDEED